MPVRLTKDAIAELKAANPLDAMIEADGHKLGRSNSKGVREGECLCSPTKSKRPFWVNCNTGAWGCLKASTCGGGDIFSYLDLFHGLSFAQAVESLGGADVDADPQVLEAREKERAEAQRIRQQQEMDIAETERRKAYEFWKGGVGGAGTPVEDYLSARGLVFGDGPNQINAPWPKALRYSANETYWHPGETKDDPPIVVHRGPCMLAAITATDGTFMGLHRTWIDLDKGPNFKAVITAPDGTPLQSKKMRGAKKGGSVVLIEPQVEDGKRALCVAGEGIETTLSGVAIISQNAKMMRGNGLGAVCPLDLGNLAGPALGPSERDGDGDMVPGADPDMAEPAMEPPHWADWGLLLGDGDGRPKISFAVMRRAKQRWGHHRVPAEFCLPPCDGDFNDVWREHLKTETAL